MLTCPNCGNEVSVGDPKCSKCKLTFKWSGDNFKTVDESEYSSSDEKKLLSYEELYWKSIKNAREEYSNAFKEYGVIVSSYAEALNYNEKYFEIFDKNKNLDKKIPEFLPLEDVEILIKVYVKTHPLLRQSPEKQKINSQIKGILKDSFVDELKKADIKARQIADDRNQKRQQKKDERIQAAGNALGTAYIVGDMFKNQVNNFFKL